MKVTDRHFLSADHKNHIHVKIWEPEGNVQGVIQIAHGMIDYIERYTAMAEYFAKKGYVVAGNDHLGHGDSVLTKEDYGYFTEKNASSMGRMCRIFCLGTAWDHFCHEDILRNMAMN